MKYKIILSILLGLFLISLISATVTTTLNSPADGSTNSFNQATLNCSASTDLGYLTNISLFTNSTGSWILNKTQNINSSVYNATQTSFSGGTYYSLVKTINVGGNIVLNYTNLLWNVGNTGSMIATFVYSNGTSINTSVQGTSSATPTMYIWTSPANISVNSILVLLREQPASTTYESLDNVTYGINSTTQTFNFNLTGITKWNCLACDNNSACSYSAGNRTVNFDTILNSINYNSTTYETSTENYILNITPTGYTPSNIKLIYNGTSYSASSTHIGSYYLLSSTLNINSSLVGTNQFYYTWNTSSTNSENSQTYSQIVSPIQFGLCNASLIYPFLNISFKDEDTLNYIKASIPIATFSYYIGDMAVNKTYTFSNTTANYYYSLCTSQSNLTYFIKSYVQYKNDTNYPQRIWDEETTSYTSSITNKTLYLLDSTSGIYVTYQVLDGIGNQLGGVQVNVNRTIEGSNYMVGTGLTDSAGSITFWLNPDFAHSISFSKVGYETFTLAHFPTQPTYTVTLGTSSSSGINDYIRGITYTVLPNYGITLNVSQLYNFNMTLNSTYWTLDSFGFILYGDGTIIGGNSSASNYGTISNILNVSAYEHISIETYWVINGTTTYGINNGWFTFDYTEGTGWSIANFFKDLSKYTSEGMFGLNTNALNFIVFVIIFLITGLVSYKFSLTSSTVITGIIFALTFLFDTALGMIVVPFGAIKHFPTIFMLLIVVASAIWEMRR